MMDGCGMTGHVWSSMPGTINTMPFQLPDPAYMCQHVLVQNLFIVCAA